MSVADHPDGALWRLVHEHADKSDGATARDFAPRVSQRAEFERLFADVRPKLWLIAAAITTDRAEADDIVQESAIIGLAKFDQFLAGTSFDHWMGQITRNLARNAARSADRRQRLHRTASRGEEGQWGASLTGHGRLPERVVQGLESLEEDARACLLLRTVGGHTYREIATITGLPEGTAMSHVHRSRQRLRAMMDGGDGRGGIADVGPGEISIAQSRLSVSDGSREEVIG